MLILKNRSHVFVGLIYSGILIFFFLNPQGKRKLVRKIAEFEKSGVKLQCSTAEGKRLLVRVIKRFKK